MNTAIYSLVASSIAQERSLEVIANNLANANTPGFKTDRPLFMAYVEGALLPAAASEPGGTRQAGPPTPMALFGGVQIDFSQGTLQRTGNDLDLAIDGEGFFAVQTPQGIRYTRQGNFTLNADGRLLTASNFPVMGMGGPVVARGGKLEVGSDGRLVVDGAEVGRLRIADFPKPYRLVKDETGLLRPHGGEGAGETARLGASIKQGYLELSNVNPIRELVKLIEASRAFESYQRSIQRLLGDEGVLARSATAIGRLA